MLSILTFSEKRKDILFLLERAPSTLSEIRDHFNVSSPEISPRIKEMEAANLIQRVDKHYHITSIGKAIAKHYKPFLDILETIEKNESFWSEHLVDDIPLFMLERMADLYECEVIADPLENIYESHKIFQQNIIKSTTLKGVSTIFIPSYPDFFVDLAKDRIPAELVLTEKVFSKVISEHRDKLQVFLDSPCSELYIIEDARVAFVVTDYFFSLSLFYANGSYDPRNDMVGYDESALKWGNDLFEYYKGMSRKITSI
nr:winged helix-turn-helix domain-containing protein [Methanolobus chelungpuianus]